MNIEPFSKTLIGIGVLLVIVGLILFVGAKFGIGRLPGDIYIKRENFSFYFPIATSVIISIVLSIIFSIMRKFN